LEISQRHKNLPHLALLDVVEVKSRLGSLQNIGGYLLQGERKYKGGLKSNQRVVFIELIHIF
jgi:hypothetical protein